MSKPIRVAYLSALKLGLRAATSILRLARPLIPEAIRRKLRGQYRSMDVRFAFAPLNILDQKIAAAKDENYLQWYAKYKNEQTESMDDSNPAARAFLDSGVKDLEICKSFGMQPHHRLHEWGTGRGRSALFFVQYLDADKYSGNDSSTYQIDLCRQRLDAAGLLAAKRPRFIVNADNRMDWMNGETVDYIYNYAVIVHVPPEDAEEIVGNTAKMMHAKSLFLCSYTENAAQTMERYTHKDWCYNFPYFERIAAKYGMRVENVTDRLAPRVIPPGFPLHYQRLLKFTLA